MKPIAKSLLNRTNLYTVIMVMALFVVLPLSQRLLKIVEDDLVVVRQVDVAQPPPPPPVQRESGESKGASQIGLDLKSLALSVDLAPIATGVNVAISDSLELGLGDIGLGLNTHATFTMKGVGFGIDGLDRPPIMIVRPVLHSGYMESKGIAKFDVLVMVKLLKDGSLSFISIEEIEYPEREFISMVREAVSRIRYSKPTIDGVPVERFARLPLTIHAN